MKKLSQFYNAVLSAVRQIPPGSTKTYKEIATLAGNPMAYRAVGSIMHKNYNPDIPCHRVIRSDKSIGAYNRGQMNKYKLLRSEGVLLSTFGKIEKPLK